MDDLFRCCSGIFALLLLSAVGAACPSVTENRPYRSIVEQDDDDDSGDDDDSSDDDDSGDDDDDTGSCDTSWIDVTEDPVSLQTDLVPIFVIHCFDCHIAQEQGDLSLQGPAVYAELVDVPNTLGYGGGMPRVTAGDPEQSYLMHKIMGCEQGDPVWGFLQSDMPPSLLPKSVPLTEAQKSLIYSWILQGAPDDT